MTDFVTNEWMRYTLDAAAAGRRSVTIRTRSAKGGRVGIDERGTAIPAGTDWHMLDLGSIDLLAGRGSVILRAIDCSDCEIESLTLAPR